MVHILVDRAQNLEVKVLSVTKYIGKCHLNTTSHGTQKRMHAFSWIDNQRSLLHRQSDQKITARDSDDWSKPACNCVTILHAVHITDQTNTESLIVSIYYKCVFVKFHWKSLAKATRRIIRHKASMKVDLTIHFAFSWQHCVNYPSYS